MLSIKSGFHTIAAKVGSWIFTSRFTLTVIGTALSLLVSSGAQALSVGEKVPECVLSGLAGNPAAHLSQFRGKVLYVDFWASWCIPCGQSFRFLNEMHEKFKDQGLQIVGVNVDEEIADAGEFLTQHSTSFSVLADASKQCAKDFAVQGMPSSYLVDRQGVVRHIHLGFRPGETEDLRAALNKLLAETGTGL